MIKGLLRIIRRRFKIAVSMIRIRIIKARYPQCDFGSSVVIEQRVVFKVSDGGLAVIGDNVVIKSGAIIVVKGGRLFVGDNAFIGWGVVICATTSISIGVDCLIAEYSTIRDQNHGIELNGIPFRCQSVKSKPITIGRNVWIGSRVAIVSGVSIGDNSVVGANAVVCKDIAEGVLCTGVPAVAKRKLIK